MTPAPIAATDREIIRVPSLFTALALLPAAALAQAPAAVRESPDTSGLADVVVTAQKISQSAQTVPIALTALSADDLEAHQAFSLLDVKYLVPNLYLEDNLSNSATPKIFMRGIGQANSAFSFDSPVGIYVDDVYYAKEVGSLVDFYDIDRIEVLRGPQGTIYGRNSSIGAVRVVTRSAPLDAGDTDAIGDVTFGSDQQRNARLSLGAPIIDGVLGFRIAFNSKSNDGFETNTVNGERVDSDDSNAVRAQLLARFSDDLSLTVRGDYLRDNSRPPVAMDFKTDDLSDLRFQSNRSYELGTARSRLESFGSSATLNWNFGDDKLTSISAWRGVNTVNAFDGDGTTAASFEVPRSDLNDRTLTQEVFVSGTHLGAVPLEWVAGAFYLHEKTNYVWSLEIFAPPSVQNFAQTVDSLAEYLQGTYALTDKLSLTAGARYTTEHKDFDVLSHLADGSFDFAFSDHSLSTDRWTWRGAVNYSFDAPIMIYASAATGFRSGGLNGNATSLADVTGGAFQPEDTTMYEAGIKSDFLEHRLRVNATYFYGKYDQLQQPVVLQNGAVSNENNSAKVNGLELETRLRPLAGLELAGTLGTLNNSIDGSTLHLPNAAHLTWNTSASYSHQAGSLGVASLGADYGWTGRTYEDAQNTPILAVGSHANLDAHASVLTPGDHWRFTLAGYNLTDKIYPIGGFYIAGGFIASTAWPSLPRRWEFSVQYKY